MPHSPLFLQLVIIIGVARLCGLLLRYIGQPAVIGEMAAGFLLGPIVFGAWFPEFHAYLFAPAALPGLTSLSTLGLVLFMFIVGVELRAPNGLREQIRSAGMVGALSLLLPMLLGIGISPLLYPLAPHGVAFWPFALFMAAAMSITAFPVLARILKDRGLTQTRLGQLALGSAAMADVFAWIVLALVVAMLGTHSGYMGFFRTVLGLIVVSAVVFLLLRPCYAWLLRAKAPDGQVSVTVLAAILIGVFSCAAVTQWLGLHEVFGAFLFGACLPRDDRLLKAMVQRLEYVSVAALMPIFFALAGLNTTRDAFVGSGLGALAILLLAGISGKVLGGAAGARMAGFGWRDSFATGSLMNARGLMELIVMKVGLDAGVIAPQLFTMLLIMALVTTFMTSPLIRLFAGPAAQATPAQPRSLERGPHR